MNLRNLAIVISALVIITAIAMMVLAKPPGPCQCWRLESGGYFCCGEIIGGCRTYPTPPAPCAMD